ncbi:MAG: nitroreductase family protein [Gemmatimonadales bacterium]|nr:nitroreductase family protein [Gemmatimonadales bacterium]
MDLAIVDRLLTTTRTVRRRLDLERPVPPAIIEQCIEIALQAPTAGNGQGWHFVVVTDPSSKAAIAEVYRKARAWYHAHPPAFLYGEQRDSDPDALRRMRDAGTHLADHLQDVPVLILACIEGRVERGSIFEQATLYGSVLPAAWSLMLALRARGLGAAWTTDHLIYEEDVARLLAIPAGVTQAVLLAVAYFTGQDFKPAPRRASREVIHWNAWPA